MKNRIRFNLRCEMRSGCLMIAVSVGMVLAVISPHDAHHIHSRDVASEQVTIMIVGDMVLESEFRTKMPPIEELYSLVSSTFAKADMVFGNLEEPLTESDQITPYKDPKALARARDFVMRATEPARVANALKRAGFSIVGLANNHMMDYGEAGLRDTLKALRTVSLKTAGGGENKSAAERAEIFNVKGVRFAFLAFSDVVPLNYGALDHRPGIASSKDAANLAIAVKRARRRADVVILLMHWGGHATHEVIPRQIELGRLAIDSGADVVVGAHPHYLQGISAHQGKPIFYSIGNFQFPTRNPQAMKSVIVQLKLRGKSLTDIQLIPVWIDHGQPRIVKGTPQGKSILKDMSDYSRPFRTTLDRGRVVQPQADQ